MFLSSQTFHRLITILNGPFTLGGFQGDTQKAALKHSYHQYQQKTGQNGWPASFCTSLVPGGARQLTKLILITTNTPIFQRLGNHIKLLLFFFCCCLSLGCIFTPLLSLSLKRWRRENKTGNKTKLRYCKLY